MRSTHETPVSQRVTRLPSVSKASVHRHNTFPGGASVRARDFPVGKRRQRTPDSFHQHHRARAFARGHRGIWSHLRLRAIRTNIAHSLNIVVQVDRRPGRRYISEVLEINGYDPDADMFDYGAIFLANQGRE